MTARNLTGTFPWVDRPTLQEAESLGAKLMQPHTVRAESAGEFRRPMKGEWYLSGAKIEAYRAYSDLATPYDIARLVLCRRVPPSWRKVQS